MFKKFISILILITMMLTTLIGCKVDETKTGENEKVVVTDQLGREVEISGKVERIVSSYYLTTSLLIALEAKDQVVGIEMNADTREVFKKAAP